MSVLGRGISLFFEDMMIGLKIAFGATLGSMFTMVKRVLYLVGTQPKIFGLLAALLDMLHRVWLLLRPTSILLRTVKGIATLVGWYQSRLSCDFDIDPSFSLINFRHGIDYVFCSIYPDILNDPTAIGPAIDSWVASSIKILALNKVAAIIFGYVIILSALDFHARLSSHRQTYMVLMLVKVRVGDNGCKDN